MKIIRNNFNEEYTEGRLYSSSIELPIFTLERPWKIDSLRPGGQNEVSCVPNGEYTLSSFLRPKNQMLVPQLVNLNLGVYRQEANLPPSGGRFLILIHPGNYIEDIIGCIAPGLGREPGKVWRSQKAFAKVWAAFKDGDDMLTIKSYEAVDK